jgi:hypothetical protein
VDTSARPRGLALAREPGWLLAWDDNGWLYLVNRGGGLQGRMRPAGMVTAACCADDGSACAAVGSRGEVWWLAPDLMARWERTVPQQAVSCALDPFGQLLAVADARGGLHLFDRRGQPVCQAQAPRPLIHLAFVPEEPFLVGGADFGLVACFNPAGRCVWRDGLVAHLGALAVSCDGRQIVVACYSDGLRRYNLAGEKHGRLALAEPCRLAALSYDGGRTLVAGMGNRLLLLDGEGQTLTDPPLDHPPIALALSALADTAFVALPDARLMAFELRDALRR